MPQHDLFDSPPITSLLLEIHDHTLLSLSDSTEVIVREQTIRGDTHFVSSVVLTGMQQDMLDTLLSRVLVAHRFGTTADVRIAVAQVTREAREHARKHSGR